MRGLIQLLVLMAFALVPGVCLGADLEKGLAAYNEGDYETVLVECQPLADEGNAAAQFCIGRLYANGFGVAMDDPQALKWYGLAAAQGHSEAQYTLGVMHANGWGVPMDDQEAAKWHRLAAEQGFIAAVTNLANLCASGMGVEQNIVEAHMWYDIAAQLGEYDAEFSRDELASKLSPDELKSAQQMAQDWLKSFNDASVLAGPSD